MEQKEKIKALVIELLNDSHEEMLKKIDRALNSGALDIENWNEKVSPMILPKTIATAILESEAMHYCTGTTYAKRIKRDVKNLRHFI